MPLIPKELNETKIFTPRPKTCNYDGGFIAEPDEKIVQQ
jgi:hypothetical protein